MRILAVSVAPLFPDVVMGGSQRVLQDVATGLGEAGHEVELLCSLRPENSGGFSLGPDVRVAPLLELKGAFPAPYETAPHRLQNTWRALAQASRRADRVYLHADAVYMRAALADRPVIRSLHDFVYEEALLSAFTLPARLTIVPSDYLRRCVAAAAGQVTDTGPVRVIPNGVDRHASLPAPARPRGVADRGPDDVILLFPHRPQPRKGLRESIAVAAEIKRRLPGKNIRLLVAAYPAGLPLDEGAASDRDLERQIKSAGGEGVVETHEWLSPQDMAGYYAFGDITLCLGSFIESFGLVPVESAAAGTPAVCANVGALRDLTALKGLSHVPPGDTGAAAQAVLDLLGRPPPPAAIAADAAKRYSKTVMVDAYIDAITGPLDSGGHEPLTDERLRASDRPEKYELAPWCYVEDIRVYHDYMYGYREFPRLVAELAQHDGLAMQASGAALSLEITAAVADGFLVPAQDANSAT